MNFESMPLADLQAELEARILKHHEPRLAYASKLAEQDSEK